MSKNKLDRVVLDTNIILSKIINSEFENLIDTLLFHSVEVYTCEEQLAELQNNLSKPKILKFLKRKPSEIIEMIRDIFLNVIAEGKISCSVSLNTSSVQVEFRGCSKVICGSCERG